MNIFLQNIKSTSPKVHCISNIVSANFCANGLLACGGLPIMAEDPIEVEEIVAQSMALSLSLGTPNQNKIKAIKLSGEKANSLNIPIVFDPVGIGASSFRMESAKDILSNINMSVIKGNVSEIKAIYFEKSFSKGIDAKDSINTTDSTKNKESYIQETVNIGKKLSDKVNSVIVITGAIDIVVYKNQYALIKNGHPMMSKITGVGCLLSTIIACFLSVNRNDIFMATIWAVCFLGICGEKAYSNDFTGSGSYYVNFLDQISSLSAEELNKEAKYEIY